ncbi:MAG: carboxypeptidase-like regulatory domain-containing protein [Ferruginibacter sp.]
MKTKSITLLLSGLILLLVFTTCKKNTIDNNNVTPPTNNFPIPSASPLRGSVNGTVVDENNRPVPYVEINLSGVTYLSNEKGFFNIENVMLDKYVSTVTVTRAGYFKAIRSFCATATRNYLSIKLIPKSISGSIDANSGGSVNLSNGTSITLIAGSVVIKGTGEAYTGTINVYASYIDPTAADISATVPGSMTGQDATNMYFLRSAAMIAVDLESPAGQPLQLAANKTATIQLPIPSSLASVAPAQIDTWSLDDRGIWIKEGQASKNGNNYTIQATHFSFWNCDAPIAAVYLQINLKDDQGNPMPNELVKLEIDNGWAPACAVTDSLGVASGIVPAATPIDVKVYQNIFNNCNTPDYTGTIGPFDNNTTVDITIATNLSNYTKVSGTVNDCNNQPVQSGMAVIYAGPYNFIYTNIINGTYTTNFFHCQNNDSVTVEVYDYLNNTTAVSNTIPLSSNNIVVPLLTVCNSAAPADFYLTAGGQTSAGIRYPGVPIDNSTEYAYVIVDIMTPGSYSIQSDWAWGMSFSSSGIFPNVGSRNLWLYTSGAPEGPGDFNIYMRSGSQAVISAVVNVEYPPSTIAATMDLVSGSACSSASITGSYQHGTALNATNTITLTVPVITTGQYYIYTQSENGIAFTASGNFSSTGNHTITLQGHGTPQSAGTTQYILHYKPGPGNDTAINGCPISITTN